jgi:hypothetical protein
VQPCQICGATEIDPGGYCGQCHEYRGPAAPQPTTSPLTVPLFLLTVIVVVLVSGTVAVVLIRGKGRTAPPAANVAQAASASASTPPGSAPPSAAPSASSGVDRCLVGEWTVSLWRLPYANSGGFVTTTSGGVIRFRADGTGEWSFGNGIRLVGAGPTRTIAVRYSGRITFSLRTSGQTFTFADVVPDVHEEILDSDQIISAGPWTPRLGAYPYACAGEVFRWNPDTPDETRLRRRR